MTSTITEFEESEYRGPLFNQLASNQFVWEPGQVFEQYIGIDYALFCSHSAILKLFGWASPPSGTVLSSCAFVPFWPRRIKHRALPPFGLNMFIQAKRSSYRPRVTGPLRGSGLRSPYWRFSITQHQQVALEKLSRALGTTAIVTYAAPVFHTCIDLYRHITCRTLIENSTFPDVGILTGHQSWNYSLPGNQGVANIEVTPFEGPPIEARLASLVHEDSHRYAPLDGLAIVENAVTAIVDELDEFWQARFVDGTATIDNALSDFDFGDNTKPTRQFARIQLFCNLFRVSWYVIGARRDGGPA